MRYLVALLAVGCVWGGPLCGQEGRKEGEPVSSPLHVEITGQEAALVAAFNGRDLVASMARFSDDLEFYHDVGGLQRYADVKAGLADLFARDNGIRRELVAGCLRVFPIEDYGAVELGAHRFCHKENGKDDCGTFEFVHVWRRDEGGWKISRAVSYGH